MDNAAYTYDVARWRIDTTTELMQKYGVGHAGRAAARGETG